MYFTCSNTQIIIFYFTMIHLMWWFCHWVVSDSCDPMNFSMPGFPILYHLPELAQTHVHWVSDAIQPSHPLSSSSPPAPNTSQHESFPMSQLFAWGGQSTGVSALASGFQRNPRADLLQNGLVGSPCSSYSFSLKYNTFIHKNASRRLWVAGPLEIHSQNQLKKIIYKINLLSNLTQQCLISFKRAGYQCQTLCAEISCY